MWVAALCMAMVTSDGDARQAFIDVSKQYQELGSFSMTVEHKDSSGMFPGKFEQKLKWKKGNAFELLVTKPTDYRTRPDRIGGPAPNYYCDGERMLIIWPDNTRQERLLEGEPNSMQGWEVSAGPILSWLLKTPANDYLLKPPESIKVTWSIGKTDKWHGEEVVELAVLEEAQGHPFKLSFYLSKDRKLLLGAEFEADKRKGWAQYKDQLLNPDLPASLGKGPSS